MFGRLWHTWKLKHQITIVKVSVPSYDPSSKGLLYKCSCGEAWAY